MPDATDRRHAQKKRRAIQGALIGGTIQVLCAGLLLWGWRMSAADGGFVPILFLVLGVADLLTLIPTGVVLRQRLKEIEGGEEDEASQY